MGCGVWTGRLDQPGASPLVSSASSAQAHGQSLPHSPADARLHGSVPHARHRGIARHSHGHALGGGHALPHPHLGALAHHRQALQPRPPAGSRPRRSRAQLAARTGLQKIEVGRLVSYDQVANTALVRILGAQTNTLGPLPLAASIAPDQARAGATCLVVALDEANPADAAIVALYNAPPTPWTQAGSATLALTGPSLAETILFPAPFSALSALLATSRDPAFTAGVSDEGPGGFALTLTRREGATQLQSGMATIAAGTGSGTQLVTFPTPFAVARGVVATTADPAWTASVTALSTTGCTLQVSGSGGPATVTVYWQAAGDALVRQSVIADWLAVGV